MKKKRGQALLEIALGLPIILMLFCGIFDFGMILYAQNSLNMVAQESVRLSGLGKSDAEVKQFALDKINLSGKSIDMITIKPDPTNTTTPRQPGTYVTLSIDYGVKYITPLVGLVLPSPFPVHTQSTIRVE